MCGCRGSKGSPVAARKGGGSAMPVGYSADFPLEIPGTLPRTIAEADEALRADDAPIRVRVISPAAGLALGQAAWVKGPGVQQHLDSGAFKDISRVSQRGRQWRVGAFTYSDPKIAKRVAAAQGTKPVEIA